MCVLELCVTSQRADAVLGVEHFKLGQKIGQYPQSQIDYILEKSYLILWISEFLYSWSICLSKLAVLTFYRRMFQLLPIRWLILLLMVACVVWILIRTFVTLFRCSPVQYYWDKSIHGRCTMDVARYYFATDLTHTLLDTLILALPIFEVLRMKLPFGQKIAVVGLFSCGFLYVHRPTSKTLAYTIPASVSPRPFRSSSLRTTTPILKSCHIS